MFELGDLPEDGGPVPDGAGADAANLPVLQYENLISYRLLIENIVIN